MKIGSLPNGKEPIQSVEKDIWFVQTSQSNEKSCRVQNVPLERFGGKVSPYRYKGRRSCPPPLEMLSHFSPLAPFL